MAVIARLQLTALDCPDAPKPDSFRVFLDPEGHPFCLVRSSR